MKMFLEELKYESGRRNCTKSIMPSKYDAKVSRFQSKISFMHNNFPLHLLKEMDIVVEGHIFHHFSCFENSYQISKDSDTTELSNRASINLVQQSFTEIN